MGEKRKEKRKKINDIIYNIKDKKIEDKRGKRRKTKIEKEKTR